MLSDRNNQWKELLTSKPKLYTYMKFKDNIYTEKYGQYCSFWKRRSLLAQFQLGILPLHIESGRFRNLKPEERLVLFVIQMLLKMNSILHVCAINIHSLEK